MSESMRRRRRRVDMGESISNSSMTHGANIAEDDEDDDDLREPLNQRVEGMARASPPDTSLSELDSSRGSRTDTPADFTPANRMASVRHRASEYEREYRLTLLHRMLMRGLPLDQIAEELRVSISTVTRDRAELAERLKNEAKKLDSNLLIGDTMGFYKEVQGMGLRAASMTKVPLNMRLAAMRTALGARADMNRFLNATGVFDVLRFRSTDNSGSTDIQRLMEMTEQLLNSDDEKTMQSLAKNPLINKGLSGEEEENLSIGY